MTDKLFLLFNARYDRLVGDAGDSPIVKSGSANQFTFGAGVSYRLAFDVFRLTRRRARPRRRPLQAATSLKLGPRGAGISPPG